MVFIIDLSLLDLFSSIIRYEYGKIKYFLSCLKAKLQIPQLYKHFPPHLMRLKKNPHSAQFSACTGYDFPYL